MRVLVRRYERQGGQEVAVDELLDVDRVRLGRGTDQHVELPDLRVALAHAEITLRPGGPFQVAGVGGNAVWVDGTPTSLRALSRGDVLDFGRFRVDVGGERDVDLLLEVHERITARDEKAQRPQRFALTLAQAGATKRPIAWLLVAMVLVPCLAVPAALRWPLHPRPGHSADAIWQSGPPSAAHAWFLGDCGRCHAQPFQRVSNATCLSCHAQRPHHTDDPRMLAQIDAVRCESCHHEHSGAKMLIAQNAILCTQCHAQPAKRFDGTTLQGVLDFAGHHPEFSARLPRSGGAEPRFEEVRLDQRRDRVEQSNLKFPHDVHLAKAGIRGPGGITVMACADCHEADSGGTLFKPVSMERHCASCHRLDFDPQDPERLLPHGAPGEVMQVIRDYYARRALAGSVAEAGAPRVVQARRRPGEVLSRVDTVAALAWADARASRVVDEVFDRRVCTYCHTVARGDDPAQPWQIAPVAVTRSFFTGARFTHAAHRATACADCHEAQASHASADVLLPSLASCRTCHGDPGAAHKVATPCVGCHGFHIARRTTIGASGQALEHPLPPEPPP